MRTIMIHVDTIVSRASAGLYLIVTVAQLKKLGAKRWMRWGFGMGLLRDEAEKIEAELENAAKRIESEAKDLEEGI